VIASDDESSNDVPGDNSRNKTELDVKESLQEGLPSTTFDNTFKGLNETLMIEDSQEAVKKSRSPHKRSISNKTKSPLVEDSRTPLLEVSNVSKGKRSRTSPIKPKKTSAVSAMALDTCEDKVVNISQQNMLSVSLLSDISPHKQDVNKPLEEQGPRAKNKTGSRDIFGTGSRAVDKVIVTDRRSAGSEGSVEQNTQEQVSGSIGTIQKLQDNLATSLKVLASPNQTQDQRQRLRSGEALEKDGEQQLEITVEQAMEGFQEEPEASAITEVEGKGDEKEDNGDDSEDDMFSATPDEPTGLEKTRLKKPDLKTVAEENIELSITSEEPKETAPKTAAASANSSMKGGVIAGIKNITTSLDNVENNDTEVVNKALENVKKIVEHIAPTPVKKTTEEAGISKPSPILQNSEELNAMFGDMEDGIDSDDEVLANVLKNKPPPEKPDPSKWKFALSNLTPEHKQTVTEFVRMFGCAGVGNQVDKNTTHIIVKTDGNLMAMRTLKYLQGVSRGLTLVSQVWCESSVRLGVLQDPLKFEALDADLGGERGPYRARTSRASGRAPLLKNWEVMVMGELSGIPEHAIKDIVVSLGARFVGDVKNFTFDSTTRRIIIVDAILDVTPKQLRKLMKIYSVAAVDKEWLLETIGGWNVRPLLCNSGKEVTAADLEKIGYPTELI